MSEFSFPAFYQKQKERVESAIENWLPTPEEVPAPLGRAMNYSVLNGGKRLRGVLVLEAARLGKVQRNEIFEALSAVVELIHAYSLVHDDLPAMDDDDFRRGKPSCHREFGEDMAILCGDSLLTLAFGIVGGMDGERLSEKIRAEIISRVAAASGWQGLIGGQVEDLKATGKELTLEELQQLHSKKTGALITLCLAVGARAAEVEDNIVNDLEKFGQKIGLAFQIKDDLLDIQGSFEKVGKDINSDSDGDKSTYPRLLGENKAQQMMEKLIEEAVQLLEGKPIPSGRLIELARVVANRDC
ncbi:MAG: polyprenyl synthetase family protein [bacterium]